MTLDMLSMAFYKFQRDYWGFGVEEEMGRSKGKGKQTEEGPRKGRMEDEDGDMEMGRAGPSSLV
ncbi:hypothetical protein ID866_12419 [Astraeus odoratus]|nr:hypothetical protein ID866_12419 [Astraeus odoratus]